MCFKIHHNIIYPSLSESYKFPFSEIFLHILVCSVCMSTSGRKLVFLGSRALPVHLDTVGSSASDSPIASTACYNVSFTFYFFFFFYFCVHFCVLQFFQRLQNFPLMLYFSFSNPDLIWQICATNYLHPESQNIFLPVWGELLQLCMYTSDQYIYQANWLRWWCLWLVPRI
jgi:hypothetical protein